jgi:hypothetical protein
MRTSITLGIKKIKKTNKLLFFLILFGLTSCGKNNCIDCSSIGYSPVFFPGQKEYPVVVCKDDYEVHRPGGGRGISWKDYKKYSIEVGCIEK